METKKITIKFTTDRNDAKTTYKHVLKTFVPYTTNYTKNGTNYVINYTLENYVRKWSMGRLYYYRIWKWN